MISLVPTLTIARQRSENLLFTLLAIATFSTPNTFVSIDACSTASVDSDTIQLSSMAMFLNAGTVLFIALTSLRLLAKADGKAIIMFNTAYLKRISSYGNYYRIST